MEKVKNAQKSGTKNGGGIKSITNRGVFQLQGVLILARRLGTGAPLFTSDPLMVPLIFTLMREFTVISLVHAVS